MDNRLIYADHQLKVPVIRRKEYTLFLEQANPVLTFVHLNVYAKWTKEVKLKFLRDWAVIKELHGGPLYALHPPEDEKHRKFLRIVGMKYVTKYVDQDGLLQEIYRT